MITVYGLKNCDTCRIALKWLAAENIAHTFKDVRKDGVSEDDIRRWLKELGPDTLVNRRGTTWRQLDEMEKLVSSDDDLIQLLLKHPALIKRPVFEAGDAVIVGFKDEQKTAVKDLMAR
ncbi:MAG: Spx/MgsR family RNA polymerase-binding regulatory protein [Rhodospirillales bacterium]|nr:Spx/MgsR family RNA polymerase-binding regulatory protein [Rhodospirillales bacterium]